MDFAVAKGWSIAAKAMIGRIQLHHLEIASGRHFAEDANVGVVAVEAADHRLGIAGPKRHLHAGILFPELPEDMQQVVRSVGDDAQGARPQGARFRQQFQRLRLGVEHAPRDLEQLVAGLRQRHLLLVAVEEEHVILLLQLSHLVGDCRLGEEKRFGRP
jgi:hypothetical protein